METPDAILQHLQVFTGTENYYPYNLLAKKPEYLLTDGVHYLCNACECFWFIDFILSSQSIVLLADTSFQCWSLVLIEKTWRVECFDGDKKKLYSGTVGSTDFPLNGINIWLIDGVLLLPSEY